MGENQTRQNPYVFKLKIQDRVFLWKKWEIWASFPLIFGTIRHCYTIFHNLNGRDNHGAFIPAEKVVFCDYMTWNAGNIQFRMRLLIIVIFLTIIAIIFTWFRPIQNQVKFRGSSTNTRRPTDKSYLYTCSVRWSTIRAGREIGILETQNLFNDAWISFLIIRISFWFYR